MKHKRVISGLGKRREIHDVLVAKGDPKSVRRPGSLNRHKTGGVSTNGGSYQKSGKKRSGGSAKTRSRNAVKSRS